MVSSAARCFSGGTLAQQAASTEIFTSGIKALTFFALGSGMIGRTYCFLLSSADSITFTLSSCIFSLLNSASTNAQKPSLSSISGNIDILLMSDAFVISFPFSSRLACLFPFPNLPSTALRSPSFSSAWRISSAWFLPGRPGFLYFIRYVLVCVNRNAVTAFFLLVLPFLCFWIRIPGEDDQ